MVNLPSPEDLDTLFQNLKFVLLHPEFQKALKEILDLPPDQREQAISTQLTASALSARGIQLPEGIGPTVHLIANPAGLGESPAMAGTAQPRLIKPVASANTSQEICIGVWPFRVCFPGGPKPDPIIPDLTGDRNL